MDDRSSKPQMALLSETDKAFWLTRGRTLGVFLISALDESADSNKDTVYGMGGFFGDQCEWNKFERLWDPMKNRLQSKGAVFHMTDCQSQRGDFRGWNKSDCDDVIIAMVDAITQVQLFGIHTAIDVKAFKGLFPTDSERSLHELSFITAVGLSAGLAHQLESPVAFIFDQKPEYAFICHAMYDSLRNSNRTHWPEGSRLGSIGFMDKANWTGLQAADLIAYEGMKHLQHELLGSGTRLRKPLDRLNQTNRLHGFMWDEPALRATNSNMVNMGFSNLRNFFEDHSSVRKTIRELQKTWITR